MIGCGIVDVMVGKFFSFVPSLYPSLILQDRILVLFNVFRHILQLIEFRIKVNVYDFSRALPESCAEGHEQMYQLELGNYDELHTYIAYFMSYRNVFRDCHVDKYEWII